MTDRNYAQHWAEFFGLPPDEWQVAVEKFKTPFGRRVVVAVKRSSTGDELVDTVVGRLTKRKLDEHAGRLVGELAERLGFRG